jgi:hypothetical protein
MRSPYVLVLVMVAAGCGTIAPRANHELPHPAPAPSRPAPAPATSRHPAPAPTASGPASGPTASGGVPSGTGPSRAAGGEAAGRLPPPVKVPQTASGRYVVVRGGDPPPRGAGPVVRYLVEVERGLPFDGAAFAAAVHRTLNDPRGWARFQRVDHGPVTVRVALSSPAMTDRQCLPLRTGGDLSCWNGSRSIINAVRWNEGVPQYGGDLAAYRQYVINHEVGHSLGHDHASCPGSGLPAPVMAQQTKSLGGCRPNPWPFPHGRKHDQPEER